MRMIGPILAASLATIVTMGLSASAWAQTAAAPAQTLGSKWIPIDGSKYGGQLPVGTDKNVDAVRVLLKAADALGQIRGNQYGGSTHLVVGDTSAAMRIDADGTWNGKKAHVVFDYTFREPGVRLDVTYEDGTRTISVAARDMAWDEKAPGVYSGQAKTSVADRMILAMLLPGGVVVMGRDAADTIKASKEGAKDVLTIPLPKLGAGVNLVARLDAEGHPVHTTIAYNGHTYTGDFEDFFADRTELLVYAPHHITLGLDGKDYADLELNWHQANPYIIFPVPREVAAK